MKRRARFMRTEKGQSLVIVAAAMVGLLALTGLAVDGGNLFWQRRRAQNAADILRGFRSVQAAQVKAARHFAASYVARASVTSLRV